MSNVKYAIFQSVLKFKLRSKDKIALVSDVDGVLTDGKFHYSDQGKIFKVFGSHDADALKLLAINKRVDIFFLTADARGFEISSKRITDMGFEVQLMNPSERVNFISKLKQEYFTIYVGDSFTDIDSMKICDFSIVPHNAHETARKNADLITKSISAEGAMAEICLLIMNSINK
jgi:3-deoxy-D-manno-octulosonate 8-phosphate phosphatase (KDO 8-P phosphatase)